MREIREFDVVRVVALRHPELDRNVGAALERAPAVGEEGVGLEIERKAEGTAVYVVESVTARGDTTWLSELAHDEVELVE